MMGRTRARLASTVALVAAMALMVPAAANAGPPDQSGVVERAPALSAWVFWDGDLIVLTGPPIDFEGCLGLFTEGFAYEGFQKPISEHVATPSGQQLVTISHTDRVWVYDDEDTTDPLEWLVGSCTRVLTGGADPVLLAQGEGVVSNQSRVDEDGVQHGYGGVTAMVTTTADGRTVHLRAHGANDAVHDQIHYGG